jgi:transposase
MKMKDFEHKYSVFEKALKIEEPWYIVNYELDEADQVLHIYLNFRRGA